MLVFGDQVQEEDPRELLRALRRAVVRMPASGAPGDAGCSAHAQRVDCLLGAGALWQGLADADFAALGHDAETTRSRLCALGTVALARAVWASHRGMIVRHGRDLSDWIDRLLAEQLPSRIDLHRPEGFAFYAVYPEQYATAASRLSTVLAQQGTVIVGLRTIGTSLAAMVAAGSGAQGLPWTARPVGPPFSRRLALSVQRSEQLRDARWVAAVDEGPGLSGSSFSAVANARLAAGGTAHGLHLFPSHPGPPGSQASDASRETWTHAQRHGATLEEVILPRLQSWVESRLECPVTLEDLSGGGWRARHYPSPQEWPATNARLERRKFLVRGRRGLHLLKFVGLGRYGEAPLQASRALSRAGFAPETLGSVHGFLLQRWCERAMPLDRVLLRGGGPQFDRRRLVEHLARYLAFRANHLPLDRAAHGAAPGRLLDMARHNVRLALGSDLAAALDRIRPPERLRPMWIDGRMHPWEWLVDGGEILKVDGVEHCQSHDLIGAQDLAWDVVGADVELGLTREACRELGLRLTQLTGRELPAASLGFHRICYLAFQLGQATLAAQMNEPEEARRLRARAEGYAGQLRSLLEPLSGGRSVRRAEHPPPL
jgi:hypothetical protein